jgi:hypothetical protein
MTLRESGTEFWMTLAHEDVEAHTAETFSTIEPLAYEHTESQQNHLSYLQEI